MTYRRRYQPTVYKCGEGGPFKSCFVLNDTYLYLCINLLFKMVRLCLCAYPRSLNLLKSKRFTPLGKNVTFPMWLRNVWSRGCTSQSYSARRASVVKKYILFFFFFFRKCPIVSLDRTIYIRVWPCFIDRPPMNFDSLCYFLSYHLYYHSGYQLILWFKAVFGTLSILAY